MSIDTAKVRALYENRYTPNGYVSGDGAKLFGEVPALCDEVDRLRGVVESHEQDIETLRQGAFAQAQEVTRLRAVSEQDQAALQVAFAQRDAALARVAELEAEQARHAYEVEKAKDERREMFAAKYRRAKSERDALRAAVDRVRAWADETFGPASEANHERTEWGIDAALDGVGEFSGGGYLVGGYTATGGGVFTASGNSPSSSPSETVFCTERQPHDAHVWLSVGRTIHCPGLAGSETGEAQ